MSAPRELVHLDIADAAAAITLDSPQNRSALSARLRAETLDHVLSAVSDPSVRVIVLTRTEPVFCAGADPLRAVPASSGCGS